MSETFPSFDPDYKPESVGLSLIDYKKEIPNTHAASIIGDIAECRTDRYTDKEVENEIVQADKQINPNIQKSELKTSDENWKENHANLKTYNKEWDDFVKGITKDRPDAQAAFEKKVITKTIPLGLTYVGYETVSNNKTSGRFSVFKAALRDNYSCILALLVNSITANIYHLLKPILARDTIRFKQATGEALKLSLNELVKNFDHPSTVSNYNAVSHLMAYSFSKHKDSQFKFNTSYELFEFKDGELKFPALMGYKYRCVQNLNVIDSTGKDRTVENKQKVFASIDKQFEGIKQLTDDDFREFKILHESSNELRIANGTFAFPSIEQFQAVENVVRNPKWFNAFS
jgi:hypothetical protein